MAQKFELTILPTGGLNLKSDPADQSMFTFMDKEGTIITTQGAGGSNWETSETHGVCKKAPGITKYNTGDTSTSTDDRWQALFLLNDGTNKNLCGVYKGKFYTITTSDITKIEEAGGSPVTFDTSVPVTMAQYGAYVVIACIGKTPYKWKHGDSALTKLILAGTEYKFKFIEQYHNRIIGAYSDQSNGSIDIRFTNALPTIASLEFPAANQLYKPDDDIGITGLKRMGNSACLVYGSKSIHSLEYYSDFTPVFQISPQITEIGTNSPYSIVDVGNAHFFYDRDRGFIHYAGGKQFKVISEPIESFLSTIKDTGLKYIIGEYIPNTSSIIWIVPTWGSSVPNAWVIYDYVADKWYQQDITATAMEYIETSETYSAMLWTEWMNSYGGILQTWGATGTDLWTTNLTEKYVRLMLGNTTGYVYARYGDDLDGSDYSSWRIEPILWLPDMERRKRLIEIRMECSETGNYSVDVYHRGGDNKQACMDASWTLLGSISLAATSDMVLYTDQTYRFHQLKWGTDLKDEGFQISKIKLKGVIY